MRFLERAGQERVRDQPYLQNVERDFMTGRQEFINPLALFVVTSTTWLSFFS